MSHDLHHNLGNSNAREDGTMTLGPPHPLSPLLLEHSNLRPAALAVHHRDDLRVGDVGRAREDLAAVLLDEQHLFDRQLVAGLARGSVNGHETAGRHLGLTAAVLDDRVHNRHLCKGVSVAPNSFACKDLETLSTGITSGGLACP